MTYKGYWLEAGVAGVRCIYGQLIFTRFSFHNSYIAFPIFSVSPLNIVYVPVSDEGMDTTW
jgi:hypothetical protein